VFLRNKLVQMQAFSAAQILVLRKNTANILRLSGISIDVTQCNPLHFLQMACRACS
jgi:hypothetical protein